ncbi:DUF3710 domain-containing protein [Corynebacterium timonense]|uniref:DUF3710 domain-containing protein n=1 Tax=Corynebacterium timonense TaxID=441500 RepID=A0A1H1NFY3_9CORY|nr:DUF3710 domain-containing protein [Corynebacterium timonense]SDR97961.1 Protein of unknown function [Corynebacterium timonense]
MALWPFGKKAAKQDAAKQDAATQDESAEAGNRAEAVVESPAQARHEAAERGVDQGLEQASDTAPENAEPAAAEHASTEPEGGPIVIPHDAVNGSTGPFDGDSVKIEDFDFSDFSQATLDLASVRIPLPKESQVQVEMGETGPKMVHIVTRFGRATPVAFASPRTGGLWETSSQEIIEGMRAEGMPARFETGPWGREIVGTGANGIIRIIGVEGPRWLYRLTLAAPKGKEDELTALGRDMAARSFIYRGSDPVLAGNSLPVVLPKQLAAQVQHAVQQRETQQRAQQEGNQQANQPGGTPNPNALADALQKLANNHNNDPK